MHLFLFADSMFYPHLWVLLPDTASAILFHIPYSVSTFIPAFNILNIWFPQYMAMFMF